jgi:hypothetical protein
MNKERFIALSLIVLAAAVSRLLPHPYNFTPIAAIALFSGAEFERKPLAFLVPLAALLISDAIIGFYAAGEMLVTYVAFAAIVCIGFAIRGRDSFIPVAFATLASAVVFFLITNCTFFMNPSLYPQNFDGLMQGYIAGLPFFRNTLTSDIFYSALLFGGFALAEKKFAGLRVATA